MHKEGNLVKPDKRKGKIVLKRSEDGLLHFQWRLRDGTIEDVNSHKF